MDYRYKYLPEAGQSLEKFHMVPYGKEPEGIFAYACSLMHQDYYFHLSFAMFSFSTRPSSSSRTPSTVCTLRIRGGVGNDLDFPSSSKNQYEIEILTQSRFMLPGHPVIDFRTDYQVPLDAGLASISINGIPVLIIAQGNDPGGRGPLANPTRALATPQQVADCDARGVRLFGIILNYLLRNSAHFRYLATFFRGDGYFAYQYIITNSNLPRTEEQARALRKEWDDVTIEKAISRAMLESYYAQYHWAEFLRNKGAQLPFNGTQIVNKFMKSNVRSFYEYASNFKKTTPPE